MGTAQDVFSFTLRDLYRSLDQRKRPEDVARMVLAVAKPGGRVRDALREAARHAGSYSEMSQDFQRSCANLDRQLRVAGVLFAAEPPVDATDLEAVGAYLASVEAQIGKQVGR